MGRLRDAEYIQQIHYCQHKMSPRLLSQLTIMQAS